MINTKRRVLIQRLLEYVLIALVYVIAYLMSSWQYAITGIFLILAGIGSYIYFAFKNERNFLKMGAVFSFAWLVTIGLSQMMLNSSYQRVWVLMSWICVCLAHVSFLVANDWAHSAFVKFERLFNFNKLNDSKFPFRYERKDNRLFWIALITSLVGITCFVANIIIRGYVPFFASAENDKAYVEFYTRLHIFVVASMVSGGLAYYCLKKLQLSIFKKIISVLIIIVMIFAIPILLVQRGTFITVAMILTAVIYLCSKKRRFILLLACIVLMLGVYQVGTSLRSYSEAQLVYLFQTEQVEVNKDKEDTEDKKDTEKVKTNVKPAELLKIKLSAGEAYFYAYLSVSHDNFNCVVSKKKENTWGMLQLIPFNVILRIDSLDEKLSEIDMPQVTTYLNTNNLIGYAYYDFGLIGVVGLMLIWSFGFGIVEAFERKYKGPFASLAYGVCMLPVALCFFNAWMSYFTTWLLWGTVLLMFIFASFTRKKRINKIEAKSGNTNEEN